VSIHRPHATKTSRTTPAQVLQCLTHTPQLANFAQELGHTSTCSAECMFCLLEKHMRKSLKQGGVMSPTDIYAKLPSFAPTLTAWRQEDAQELLTKLLEAMHGSCMLLIGRTRDGACAGGSARVREDMVRERVSRKRVPQIVTTCPK
jgi:hypothetical protein